jgi:hypothetical protein
MPWGLSVNGFCIVEVEELSVITPVGSLFFLKEREKQFFVERKGLERQSKKAD